MTMFEIGGIDRMVQNLASASCEFLIRTTVFAHSPHGRVRIVLMREGIETVFLPTGPEFRPGLAPQPARELMKRRVDDLHAHHPGPRIHGAMAAGLA